MTQKLDPEALEAAIDAINPVGDPRPLDFFDVETAITAYLAHLHERGVALMPREPSPGNVIRFVEWRLIETAPKDGTKILLGKIVGHPDHATALWWAVRGFWSERWGNWNDGVEPSGLAGPTHWMPIDAYGAHDKEQSGD